MLFKPESLNTKRFYTIEKDSILFSNNKLNYSRIGSEYKRIHKYTKRYKLKIDDIEKNQNISQIDFNILCFNYINNYKLEKDSDIITNKLKEDNIVYNAKSLYMK